MNDQTALPPEEEKEPTEKELLEARIAELEAKQDESFNLWRQHAIESLREELRRGFDDEGAAIPITPENEGLRVQFSPEEAVNAPEDLFWITYPRGIMGEVPAWIADSGADPNDGLALTVRRSNGCFGIYNVLTTSEDWINNAQAVADQYGCSRRVIQVAGHAMKGYWYLLPTADDIANPYGRYGYALQPDIPFNDEEKQVWREMFVRYHLVPFGKSMFFNWHVELHAARVNAAERERVDPNGRHQCITVVNNPQLIVPALMAHFNTTRFKARAYQAALITCRAVDAGRTGRVPGYMTVEEMGGDFSNPFDWYAENESTDVTKAPRFNPGAQR